MVKSKIIIILSLLLILGCQTPKNWKKDVEKKRTDLVDTSEKPPPEWITNQEKLPDKKEGYEYFCGLSGKFSSEKNARDDAEVNAIKKIVQYVGVRMEVRWEQIAKIRQRASETLNPEIVTLENEFLIAEALIKGSKAVNWYWEKYENFLGNTFYDSFYKAYVAVSISLKNLEDAEKRVEEIHKKALKMYIDMKELLKSFFPIDHPNIKKLSLYFDGHRESTKTVLRKKSHQIITKKRLIRMDQRGCTGWFYIFNVFINENRFRFVEKRRVSPERVFYRFEEKFDPIDQAMVVVFSSEKVSSLHDKESGDYLSEAELYQFQTFLISSDSICSPSIGYHITSFK